MSNGCQCRSCGNATCVEFLDLGMQPLANNLLSTADLRKPEPRFPLVLTVCPSCWLLQITQTVPPVELFSDYVYFSSFSDTMLGHAHETATRYIDAMHLDRTSFVVEIASNDGYMLRNFRDADIPCLGVEPAANIAAVAKQAGIRSVVEFFTDDLAQQVASDEQQADLILGNNVFAHVPNINDFVAGLRSLLKPDGSVVLEFPYAVNFLEENQFDTIYHEHIFYFSLIALLPLFERHGLAVYDVERIAIHGGSLRLFVGHAGLRPATPTVDEVLASEKKLGLTNLVYYTAFAERVQELRASLLQVLAELAENGASLAAYGASAKGSTLLNYLAIDSDDVAFCADRSTYKQGKLTPGSHIPIVAPEQLLADLPDYALLLTWNFADEIMDQQRQYRERGGKFIIPIPTLSIR